MKRADRGDDGSEMVFHFGRGQKTPKDFKNLMTYSSFKKELLRFLFEEYESAQYSEVIRKNVLYLSVDNECKKLFCVDGTLKKENVFSLYGYHLEADTRVMFHARHADNEYPGNIVVRGNDTDIFVILIVNVHQLKRSHLWYECGLDHDNSRAFYDSTRLAAAIPFKMALPTPSFFRKGKVRPLKLMLKHQKFIDAFSSLGEGPLTLEVCSIIEEFVSHLYGFNQLTSLADGVLAEFENKLPTQTYW